MSLFDEAYNYLMSSFDKIPSSEDVLNSLTEEYNEIKNENERRDAQNFQNMLSAMNPMTMLTPILTTTIIFLGLLTISCTFLCGFRWFLKSKKLKDNKIKENIIRGGADADEPSNIPETLDYC